MEQPILQAFHVPLQALPDMLLRTHTRQFFSLIMLACMSVFSVRSQAQCASPISSFPYLEGFETGSGNWVSGGTAASWANGSPSKPVINSAASGTRCWVTGGLNGGSYNDTENSWLQSPCFDFSSLTNPEIRLSIFWETELQYDGANLQYSIDEGASWTVLGSEASNTTCLGTNWYNYSPVQFLGDRPGWSGNIQASGGGCRGGQGSGQWITARHTLSMLAGRPKVLFRFGFGSGRICNAFDGFAVDNIEIREAAPNSASFAYNCGASRSISFTSTASDCAAAYSWNFGDPSSGASNTSSNANPSHVFSAPGNYRVSLAVSFLSGAPVVYEDDVTVFDASARALNTIRCNGEQTGSAIVEVEPASTSYTYSWSTSPPQTTATAVNLGAGNYSVQVTGPGAGCVLTVPVQITEPPALSVNTTVTNERCGGGNGKIEAIVTGGTPVYTYTWSNGAGLPVNDGLPEGNYSLAVNDANGCSVQVNNISVTNDASPVPVSLGPDRIICPGETIILNPGSFSSYRWQDGSTQPEFRAQQTGTYTVTVEDDNGCQGTASVRVKVECNEVYFPNAFSPDGNGLNDGFGPAGDVSVLREYTLRVYNRWGQLMFTSIDPSRKWDGTFLGKRLDPQTCVWICTFNLGGNRQTRSGSVTLIR